MFERNGRNLENGDFDWADAILDALIVGGQAAVAVGLASLATGPIGSREILVIGLTGAAAFLGWLATKRGLRVKE